MKGFVALDAHPGGCARMVGAVVESVRTLAGPRAVAPLGPVVVVGSSGGYGLPAAAVAAFRYGAPVLGVCLEGPAERGRTASAGWYNVIELHRQATESGASVTSFNANCFADSTKQEVIDRLRVLAPPAMLIYSVAAPVRTDPISGVRHRSVLKPGGLTSPSRPSSSTPVR